MKKYWLIWMTLVAMALSDCRQKDERLPILGRREIKNIAIDGGLRADTLYHTIADFAFVDQDSSLITNATFEDNIYVADFFFTTCPTICPVMKSQMLRLYETFEGEPAVKFLSHSIDPNHDSVAVLKSYAERLGVASDRWHFVTGDKDELYNIGQTSYMVTARDDPSEPGGILHSGAFLLIDKQRRIRGIYDGTEADEVDELIADIRILLTEYAD
jgi:protein SCO1/2